MKTLTRESYARRIERVVDYLIDHLDGDVDLHRLAEEAFLSPYHFHRVYHAMTGETVAESVRRLRLHRAAVKLISSDIAIAMLAKEAGYGSVQAFNRAFRDGYGTPPAAYREKQARAQLRNPSTGTLPSTEEKSMYPITIRDVKPCRIVALRHQGEYMNIGNAFERLNVWAAGLGLLDDKVRWFGIYYDDPAATPAADLKSGVPCHRGRRCPTGRIPHHAYPRRALRDAGVYGAVFGSGEALQMAVRRLAAEVGGGAG